MFRKRADLVVDQDAPEFVSKFGGRRCGNPRNVEVFQVGVELTIIGEAAGFGGCIESVGGSVTGSWVGVGAVARPCSASKGYIARA